MNNRNSMFKSVLPIAATGVAILGIVRGIRSRSFQPFFRTVLSSLMGAAPQGMMGGQTGQNTTQPLQGMMNNQGAQQQPDNQQNPQISQSMMGGQAAQNMAQPPQGTMNNQGYWQQSAVPKNSARH